MPHNDDYVRQITDLLSLMSKMINECNYSDLEDISHKRIAFMDNMLNTAIFNGYYQYNLMSWFDYDESQEFRKHLMSIYRTKLVLGK